MDPRSPVAVTLLLLSAWAGVAEAGPYSEAVDRLEFGLLQATFDEGKSARLLAGHGKALDADERAAAAVLVSLGAIEPDDLDHAALAASKLDAYIQTVSRNHPSLMGRIGDASLYHHMAGAFTFDELLSENVFLDALGEELSKGVLTGYDLRMKDVYDDFPPGHTFVYSQSSLMHMRQLVALLHSEDVGGWVYITPKVSAFLYREDWGPASDAVVTLPGGVRVVQGREIAVLFQFDSPDDRQRFHEVVTRFAKKDVKDEPGLIANSWWQPFYYTDQPLPGFKPISLVVVTSDRHEATLTVLEARTAEVTKALEKQRWPLRVDRVWVNPAFYRFLNGDYK